MAENPRHLALPRGFHDATPDRAAAQLALQQEWLATCRLAGYQPVQVPPVGFAETFTAGHHAAGHKLYRFPDHANRELALVSDSLPALLRLAHTRGIPEQRLSFCCPIFRYERRPRRHFHHLGLIETADRPTSLAEQQRATTRLARLLADFLTPRLPVVFTVTDPGIWHTLARTALPHTTGLVDTVRRLPLHQRPAHLHHQHASPAAVAVAELLAADPGLDPGHDHLSTLTATLPGVAERIRGCHYLVAVLRRHGAQAAVDLTELHASEFHGGPAFVLRPPGQRRLLGDGGSYGLFASTFLGAPTTAHSAIIGLERLADLTTNRTRPAADLAILAHDQSATTAHAEQLTATLRAAGVAVWDVVLTRPLRRHLRDLAALAIPHSLIVGPQELVSGHYTLRDRSGALHDVAHHDLPAWLTERRPGHG